jgi:NAD+ diphosphatase
MSRESIYKRYQPAVSGPGNTRPGYWFVFLSTRLLIRLIDDRAQIPRLESLEELNLSAARTQFLGTFQGHPCYSAEASSEDNIPLGMSFRELRSLYPALDEDEFLLAGKALQIISWDQNHQFCGKCGFKTETLKGERAKKCPACGAISYPRITPAAITAVLKDNQILLTHNVAFRGNFRSLIAGFVEPGETLEECVHREILEEVGLQVKNVRYFGSQPWPFPNSLMIGFTADYESGEIRVDGTEISEADWYDARHLPDLPGKLSIAREIIDWFIATHSGD